MEMFDPREYIPQFRLEIELKETWKKKSKLIYQSPAARRRNNSVFLKRYLLVHRYTSMNRFLINK